MKKIILLLVGLSCLHVVFAKKHIIPIQNGVFNPFSLTIQSGDTVEWINNELGLHRVGSSLVPQGAQSFESSTLTNGASFQVVLTVEGNYFYQDKLNTGTTGMIVVEKPVISNVAQIENSNDILVYPNPTKSIITIEGNGWTYQVYNMLGEFTGVAGTGSNVDVQSLETGFYFLALYREGELIKTVRVIKE